MMLTDNKQKILDDIETRVYSATLNALYIDFNSGSSSIQNAIAHAITQGIREAIDELISKTYLTQDFEKDIGLG